MQFRFLGIPVEVRLSFWLMSAFLGFGFGSGGRPGLSILLWVAVVFVSVMVHELGHAFAFMRHGIQPAIVLHGMGGKTHWRGAARLTRMDRIVIDFAGPLAGFVLGGLVYVMALIIPPEPESYFAEIVSSLLWVNVGWGLFNLIPVVPMDGGNIMKEALGPARLRTSSVVSLAIAVALAVIALALNQIWIMFLMAISAFHSYQQYQAAVEAPSMKRMRSTERQDDGLPQQLLAQLKTAQLALEQDQYDKAGTIAENLLADPQLPTAAKIEALHILGWAHLLEGRPQEAAKIIHVIEQGGEVDPALVGCVLHSRDDHRAREVLETARANGDNRKVVIGPLVQILIKEGEIERAAAIALDVVDTLSEDDTRQMAQIATEAGAHLWAGRLYEALFERTELPDDAYDSARCYALYGHHESALLMLRRAVAAGFSDAARAWSDGALEQLRASTEEVAELESVLPRPSS